MTSTSESHEEASTSMSRRQRRPRRNVSTHSMLNAKKMKKIGCWNVRTLNGVGRTAILTAEMRKYNLSILGVSELRLTGNGRLRTSTGESVLFSGSEDKHERGVALFLAKGLEKCLIEWEPVNERIVRGRFYGKQLDTTIIQIYAPTNEADPEDKEEFYEQLSKITEKVPRQDLLIVMGDANAKVGRENVGREDVMGKEGLGDRNENGDLFIDFCAQNELVIGGTLFKHKNIHKYT